MMNLNFRLTELSDITSLVDLINQSYREQQGRSWTTEIEFVKGQRISQEQLQQQLELSNSLLITNSCRNRFFKNCCVYRVKFSG